MEYGIKTKEELRRWLVNVASVYDMNTTNAVSIFYSDEYNQIGQLINSSNVYAKCCRCGKETLFYVIAPYGSKDDGEPICAKCLDDPSNK